MAPPLNWSIMETVEMPVIEVAGRRFHPVGDETTFEQDLFIMGVIQDSGLEDIELNLEQRKLNKQAEYMLLRAFNTGNLFRLLCGIMVEEGVRWSIESAEANAEFFANLTDKKDKKAIQGVLVGTVLSFFYERGRTFRDFSEIFKRAKPGTAKAKRSRSRREFGVWDYIVRRLAGHDPNEFQRILSWPIREGLLAYVEILREDAKEQFRIRLLAHAIHGGKAPELPPLLKE